MGLIKGILSFTGKVAGELANEAVKTTLGVDIKGELENGKRATREIDYYLEELERGKEEFIKQNGEKAYDDEKRKLEKRKNDIIKCKMMATEAKMKAVTQEKKDEYQRKIKQFSDEQLEYLERREETPNFLRNLVQEEQKKRNK